jgi:hypothetical protein
MATVQCSAASGRSESLRNASSIDRCSSACIFIHTVAVLLTAQNSVTVLHIALHQLTRALSSATEPLHPSPSLVFAKDVNCHCF